MINIRKPLSFSEIGRKENQEDYLFPSNVDEDTRIFILCDGMGGHDNGEVASMTAACALGDYLITQSEVDRNVFNDGLEIAYNALDSIDTNSVKRPGTTMASLCVNDNSCLVAHIGDSRIYQIRPSIYSKEKGVNGIVFQTSDHSLVNELLKAGELTEEEARSFPQKNVITRAMQPHLERRFKADVEILTDIKTGDYFFLCCDGVLEQLTNDLLGEILADQKLDDAAKLNKIQSVCDGKTRDNYTCWLIPIDNSDISEDDISQDSVIRADVEMSDSVEVEYEGIEDLVADDKFVKKNGSCQGSKELTVIRKTFGIFTHPNKCIRYTVWMIFVALVVVLAIYGIKTYSKNKDADTKQIIIKEHPKHLKQNKIPTKDNVINSKETMSSKEDQIEIEPNGKA